MIGQNLCAIIVIISTLRGVIIIELLRNDALSQTAVDVKALDVVFICISGVNSRLDVQVNTSAHLFGSQGDLFYMPTVVIIDRISSHVGGSALGLESRCTVVSREIFPSKIIIIMIGIFPISDSTVLDIYIIGGEQTVGLGGQINSVGRGIVDNECRCTCIVLKCLVSAAPIRVVMPACDSSHLIRRQFLTVFSTL